MACREVTGNALKVGDVVVRAKSPPKPTLSCRPTDAMQGVVVKVIVGGGSGGRGRGKKPNAVRVRWASGHEAKHDAVMIVKKR